MPYTWGEPTGGLPQAPDAIIGADVVYEQEHYAALVSTLHMLAAPHTIVYLSYRLRGMLPPLHWFPSSQLRIPLHIKRCCWKAISRGITTLHMCITCLRAIVKDAQQKEETKECHEGEKCKLPSLLCRAGREGF